MTLPGVQCIAGRLPEDGDNVLTARSFALASCATFVKVLQKTQWPSPGVACSPEDYRLMCLGDVARALHQLAYSEGTRQVMIDSGCQDALAEYQMRRICG